MIQKIILSDTVDVGIKVAIIRKKRHDRTVNARREDG